MEKDLFNKLNYNNPEPVTVLGKTFANDDERREWFRNELRKKLPELKEIEGFPIGEDEDIIKLSDPPFYTACPNPWLNEFIDEWEKEKKELEKQGLRISDKEFVVEEPYASDVSEGKNNPIYMAHSYHTKVPHPAIMRYIMHYTQPGDIVFDGFAGTGMTGVAASMCANPESNIKQIIEKENPNVKWGKRNAICGDLSPIASFIAYNYNKATDIKAIELKFKSTINNLEKKYGNLYLTKHGNTDDYGIINYIIYSDVFICKNCGNELIYYENAVIDNKINNEFNCKFCGSLLKKTSLQRAQQTIFDKDGTIKVSKTVPYIINYTYNKVRYEKIVDKYDMELISEIENKFSHINFPSDKLPIGFNTIQPINSHGFIKVNQFFSKRSNIVLNELRHDTDLLFLLTASMWNASFLYRWRSSGKGGIMNGVLYVSSLHQENNIFSVLKNKARDIIKALKLNLKSNPITTSSIVKNEIKKNSVDYIFTDPPFGANIMYSELSYLWESWLSVKTAPKTEIIENKFQNKNLHDYSNLMTLAFKNCFEILKPGKWMTVEFSNTKAAVWNAIQTALQNSGFVITNVAALDKKQGSFKAVTTPAAVKQDLVISCYKPSHDFDEKFKKSQYSEVGVWDFIEEYLGQLSVHLVKDNATTAIIDRSPKILFDRLISFYISRHLPVPIDAGVFQKGLRERFIERDGMFFSSKDVEAYDRKKAEVPEFIQLNIFVNNEKEAIYWLRQKLEEPKAESDLHPMWMTEVAGNMRKGDTLPEMRNILEENFLRGENGKWYIPDMENEADLEKIRSRRLLKIFDDYKEVIAKPRAKLNEVRVEALRAGFKQCYQDKDFKTIIAIGDRIPNNLLMEDEVLLQYYDIASSRV